MASTNGKITVHKYIKINYRTIMAKKSFEENLKSLEQITQELESGDLSLDVSLKKFDEGIKLAELCNEKLDEAQKKIDVLLKKNGTLSSQSFDEFSKNNS